MDLQTLNDAELKARERELVAAVGQHDSMQKSLKEILAAAYGTMAARHFRFFDNRIARSITISGQLSVKSAEKAVNGYLKKNCDPDKDYIIAMDTDSIYVDLDDLVKKYEKDALGRKMSMEETIDFLDEASENAIGPIIDKAYADLAEAMNAYSNSMAMKREVIATSAIWTGKKKYALNVNDDEGVRYAEPKIKVVGLEVVRTSTPKICRDEILKALKILLNEDDNDILIRHIAAYEKKFRKMTFVDIAFPRGINKLSEYRAAKGGNIYEKGTPMHVKAALIYNKCVEQSHPGQFRNIKEGDKIRFAHMKKPNPWGDSVLAIPDTGEYPEEWNLEEFLDYREQFDKAFLKPLERLSDARGWLTRKKRSLDSFF